MIDKSIIKNNFSKYAHFYDKYSDIQNICASELIKRVDGEVYGNILDLGCGTGNFTALLRDKFPDARIKAVDISAEMIKVAKSKLRGKNIDFMVADGEKEEFNEHFDLISSNAGFQWFGNLEKTLARYRNALSEEGAVLFSTFGPGTFIELNESLKRLFGENASISSGNFLEKEKIEKILKGFFKQMEVEKKIYKEEYSSLKELLKKIKYSGVRGAGINTKNFWSPGILSDLENLYGKNIIATYEVFFCKARK